MLHDVGMLSFNVMGGSRISKPSGILRGRWSRQINFGLMKRGSDGVAKAFTELTLGTIGWIASPSSTSATFTVAPSVLFTSAIGMEEALSPVDGKCSHPGHNRGDIYVVLVGKPIQNCLNMIFLDCSYFHESSELGLKALNASFGGDSENVIDSVPAFSKCGAVNNLVLVVDTHEGIKPGHESRIMIESDVGFFEIPVESPSVMLELLLTDFESLSSDVEISSN
ncbi:hypothetical protein PIB30_017177 [Stylosanthes scabra]|uniref:Uncharacterized protein n=1 Tax=Stylosanthes scabra TaxID=79078 RepID=A0ABU6X786_9FABA|nr:hypothetical protein [Stylosanthes scabra]